MVKFCRQGIIGHPSRSVEDNSVESNVDYGDPNQAVSESNNINKWVKNNCCNILAKNMAIFALVLRIFLRLN